MISKQKTQVDTSHYFNLNYDAKSRWISYWYQITEVISQKPASVLEIGIGNGIVSSYLKKIGIKVTTCDFDKTLNPDVVGDVRKLPFKSNSFDLVLCAEVLEHIPFSDFKKALKEIKKVSKKWAIITLPHFSITNLYFGLKLIPYISKKEISMKIDIPMKHKFLGEHYWEIGKKGYSLDKIKKTIEKSGLKIEKDFYPKENSYHHFFILKVKGK